MDSHAVGWGLVGLGRIAGSQIAPAIAASETSTLASVVSRDQGRAEDFARVHGAATALDDYAKMLADPAVAAVYIATPNALHAEQVVAAAAAGKHVLCDKPLATTVADARRCLEACHAAGVKLGVNFQKRHHRFVPRVRQMLAGARIGDVVVAEIEVSPGRFPLRDWRSDPSLAGLGAINNLGVHAYDLLRYLLGSEVTEVTTFTDAGRDDRLESLALALLRFANGALAYANANQVVPQPRADLVLYGSEGRIVGRDVTHAYVDGGEVRTVAGNEETVEQFPAGDAFIPAMQSFQEAVLENREPNASGIDGLRSAQLTAAIARSAREGRTVAVDLG